MIVFIDDDNDDLQLIREMAGIVGSLDPLITFNNSEEALAFITKEWKDIKIIVTDINMPGIDGFQLRKRIADLGPAYSAIPFILMSTSRSEVEQLLANQLGIHTFYKKPSTFMGMKEILLELRQIL